MKKIIALFLAVAVSLLTFIPVAAQTNDTIAEYTLEVNSNLCGLKKVSVIKPNGKILMDVDDIVSLTNSTRSDEEGIIVLKRGSRNVNINTTKKQIIEAHLNEGIPLDVEFVEKKVYVPAYSMLTYLGASCSLKDGAVYVNMPLYTFWDASNFDMAKYTLDLNQIWGDDLKAHMLYNEMVELIYNIGIFNGPAYSLFFIAGYDKVIDDVMHDVLAINPLNYSSSIIDEYKSNFDLIKKRVDESISKDIDSYDQFEKIFSETLNVVSDFFKYVSEGEDDLAKKILSLSNSDKQNNIYKYLSDELENKYTKLNAKDKIDIALLVGDVLCTYYTNSNYAEDGILAIGSFKDEMEIINKHSPYYKVSNKIYCSLQSDESIVATAIMDKLVDRLIEEFSNTLAEVFIGNVGALIVDLADLGISLYSLIPNVNEEIERSSAEFRAMYLVSLQSITCQLLTNLMQDMGNTMVEENLTEYQHLLSFWVRTTMAANEKLIECGINSEIAKNQNDELATILFKLNNCKVEGISWEANDPIFDKAELKEKLGGFEWVIEPSIEAEDIQPLRTDLPYDFGNAHGDDFNYGKINQIKRNGKNGGINYDGKIVIPCEKDIRACDMCGITSDGEVDIYDENGNRVGSGGHGGWFSAYDVRENIVYTFDSEMDFEIENDLSANICVSAIKTNGKFNMDFGGVPEYDALKTVVYVNSKCKLITDIQFEEGCQYCDGLAACKKDGKWGYINEKGKTVIPFEYDYAYSFGGGIAAVCKNGKWGYIDKDNNAVIDFKLEATRPQYNGKAWAKQDGKWGVVKFEDGIVSEVASEETTVGKNGDNNITVQNNKPIKNVKSTAVGSCNVFLAEDRRLFLWGVSNLIDCTKPRKVLDNVVSFDVEGDHAAAITKGGDLYTWGGCSDGKLGNGKQIGFTENPQRIMGNVASVSIGECLGVAITKDGSLYKWGFISYNSKASGSDTPVKVMDNVASAVVSPNFWNERIAVITNDGSLYMWGDNIFENTDIYGDAPMKIMDDVASVCLGEKMTAVVKKDGSLYAWGEHTPLGNGTIDSSNVPIKIMDNVASVFIDDEYCAAITKNESLYMWGYNDYGQIGNGTVGKNILKPVKIMDNVLSVSLDRWNSACITKDGSLYAWGDNSYGQLGTGTTKSSLIPVKIMADATSASISFGNSICTDKNGIVYRWGAYICNFDEIKICSPENVKIPSY